MKTKAIILFTILIGLSVPNHAQRPEWAGIWGIWGGEVYSHYQYPWYKGTMVSQNWTQIQPERNKFNFATLDRKINEAVNNGLFVIFNIYVAPDPPAWLNTELGIGFFRTTVKYSWNQDPVFPYYLDPKFEEEFKRMISAVAEHIDTYPANIRKKILGVLAPVGKSSDPQPYDGTPLDPQYTIGINSVEWRDYNRRMFQYYYDAFKNKSPEVIVVIKPMSNNEDWVFENLPKAGRKTFSTAQGYHMARETRNLFQQENLKNGIPLLRGEFDRAVLDNTEWYQAAPIWNIYWSALWQLTYNVDIWNIRTQIMDNPNAQLVAFNYFTKWAGVSRDTLNSPGGWIAFRDDLDCADTVRFPVSVYGSYVPPYKLTVADPSRFNAIVQEFAPYGAKQDDPDGIKIEDLQVILKQKGLNDVQWEVWRDNYGKYITQINPNLTSQGYWRVGLKSDPYGRFARGFNHAQGKNAIYLDVNHRIFSKDPSPSAKNVSVSIIYYDGGTGKWEVRYDAVGENNKLALEITNGNTNKWKSLNINLSDAQFMNQGPSGSDISIVNADEQDNIFHRVEILKSGQTGTSNTEFPADDIHYHPNPFNPSVENLTIECPNSPASNTRLQVFSSCGKQVIDKRFFNSNGTITWDGRSDCGEIIKNGYYFGRLTSLDKSYSFKIIIVS